jgi:hypothetical protein
MKTPDYNNVRSPWAHDMEQALTESQAQVRKNSHTVSQSTDRERENTMLENTNPFDAEIEKQPIWGDTAEFSGRSRWNDFFLTLKLVGIALAILGAIWGIEFLQKD